jgi:hypothetical protein
MIGLDDELTATLRNWFEWDGHVVECPASDADCLALLRAVTTCVVVLFAITLGTSRFFDALDRELWAGDGGAFRAETGHCAYICLTTNPQFLAPVLLDRLAALAIPVLGMPFDLDQLDQLLDQAARHVRDESEPASG